MPPEVIGKSTITIYLDTDIADKVKEVAEKADRSVNYILVQMIKKSLE